MLFSFFINYILIRKSVKNKSEEIIPNPYIRKLMKIVVVVYWRKDKIVSKTRHEFWQFWSGGHNFSCLLLSIHKKRRPKRIFLGFARYRPLGNYGCQDMGKFVVEERERYTKTIKPWK